MNKCMISIMFGVAWILAVPLYGQTTYPDLLNWFYPADNPALPGAFDIFLPPVTATTPPSTVPGIAEWTKTVSAGESLAVTGINFSAYTGDNFGKDTQFLLYGQHTAGQYAFQTAQIQRLNSDIAAITLNDDMIADSMYFLWARNNNGCSFPVAVNKTETWWIGPDTVTRGETTSVFGRNLSHDNGTMQSWVYIKPTSGSGEWVTVTAVNAYKIDFIIPESLTNGTYEVWVHNGHGGKYGWAEPLTLTVRSPFNYTSHIYDVMSYGATGNGVTDDTTAICNAMSAAASNPGSTVYFPEGTYLISYYLQPPSDTLIDGAGSALTTLLAHPTASFTWFFRNSNIHNMQIRNMKLDRNGNPNFQSAGGGAIYIHGGQDISLTNLDIYAKAVNASGGRYSPVVVDSSSSQRIFLKNIFAVAPIEMFFGSVKQLFIDNTTVYMSNDTDGAFLTSGAGKICIVNSIARNLDDHVSDGWGVGRLYRTVTDAGGAQQVYIGNNQTFNLGVRPEYIYQGKGEQLLFEGNCSGVSDVLYQGYPTSATATTVTFADLNSDYSATAQTSTLVYITIGKGVGQVRRLVNTDLNTGTITIDMPWNLVPDSTSKVHLARGYDRIVVYNNHFDGRTEQVTQTAENGAHGVVFYQSVATNIVVAGNQITDERCGIRFSPYQKPGSNSRFLMPQYFNMISGNTITNSRNAIRLVAGHNPGTYPTEGRAFSGNIFRGNIINQALNGYGEVINFFSNEVDMNIFEYNAGSDLQNGFNFRSDINGWSYYGNINSVLLRNDMQSSLPSSQAIYFAPGQLIPALGENTWSGFATDYAGILPGPVLEVPQRLIELTSPFGGNPKTLQLELWNAGPSSLSWSANDDVSWLNLSATSGLIVDQSAASTITLTIDPAGLDIGSYTGTVTITAGTQVKKVTVKLTVKLFEPGDIGGLSLWLCADAGVTKDANNVVSQWADQSGNGNNAVPMGSSTNVMHITRPGELNGLPCISFTYNAYNNGRLLRGALEGMSTTEVTYAVVFTYNQDVTGFQSANVFPFALIAPPVAPATTEKSPCKIITNTAAEFTWNNIVVSSAGYSLSPVPTIGNFFLVVGTMQSGQMTVSVNGQVPSGMPKTVTAMNLIDRYTLGGIQLTNNGGVSWFTGYYAPVDIAEVIVYRRGIGTTDRQLLENYLNSKYALW